MRARQRQVHRVLEQLRARHLLAQQRLAGELEQQRKIELAGAQPRDDRLRLALGERQLDVGVGGAERGDRKRHQRRAGRREGGHAQAPAAQAGDRRQRRLGRVQPREDALGVPNERLAGGGQADAARVALQQRQPGFGLERGDLLGDRRLGVGERGRRPRRTSRGRRPR